jgi:hypothetical protein
MNRYPPASVMRTLRQEVGFGCHVRGCGNPYLEYHHFDPPWSVREHHEPAGMIALCAEHHGKADVPGAFPAEYLRELKEGPPGDFVRGRFDWLLRDFVVVMGGAYAAQCWIPVSYGDRPVISFHRDAAGFLLLNIDMPSSSVAQRLRMWESTWYQRGAPKDLECPPSGRLLKISYRNGDYLRIEFRSISTKEEFAARFQQVQDIGPAEASYPLTAIEIELRLAEADLHINKDVFRVNGHEMRGTLARGGAYFIGIGTHEPISRLTDNIGYSRKRCEPRVRLASQNDDQFIPIDTVTFEQRVLGLDGFAFDGCTFRNCRLMFSGRPFSIARCLFPGSAIVLTDEAVTTCQAIESLRRMDATLDITAALSTIGQGSSDLARDGGGTPPA